MEKDIELKKIEEIVEETKKRDELVRILWVDDDYIIRTLGKEMLTALGHEVYLAESGKQALELLTNNNYDLMITDIRMPNMSGWQLAERIKGKYSGMKIAVVTGLGNDINQEQKNQYGVEYVLRKPVKMKKLESLVNEVYQMKT